MAPMSTAVMSSEEVAARAERGVATATAAGRELGLPVEAARVLHDAFSVIVHLAPSPVVIRMPVALPPGLALSAQVARQARELAAVAWLDETGVPVVRPSPLVPRRPVQRDGATMTLWEYVELDPAEPDWAAQAALVPNLHATLRDYPGELPFMAPIAIMLPSCLEFLTQHPDLLVAGDLERAQREWELLAPLLSSRAGFEAAFPGVSVQPIHGDAPSYNLIRTPTGHRFADFEDVTLGPVEWDMALLGPESVTSYDGAAARAGVRPLDRDVLRVMDASRMLQLVACMAMVPQFPTLTTGLAPSLASWRSMPLAGGVA
jgi:hypothetical protein